MPAIVDVYLNADGTLTHDGQQLDGPPDAALRLVLSEIAEKAQASGVDTVVRVHRADGGVSTINALRDGGLRRPVIDPAAAQRRSPASASRSRWTQHLALRNRYVVAGALALATFGIVGVVISGGNDTAPASSATPLPNLARIAPDGWSSHVNWDISPVGDFAPVTSGDRILYLTPQATLRAVNANGGALVWESQPLTAASAAPVVGGSGDKAIVAAKAGTAIEVLPLAGSGAHLSPTSIPSTPSATLTSNGEGILVTDAGAAPAILTTDRAVAPLTVPAGNAVYEVLDDDTAVVSPAEGPWSILRPGDQPPATVSVTSPGGAVGAPHAVSSVRGVVVAWWNTDNPQNRIVAFHDARSGKVLAAKEVPAAVTDNPLPTVVSEDRTLLSAGPVLADSSTQQTVFAPAWKPSNATSGNIFGSLVTSSSTVRAQWTGRGEVVSLTEGAAVPWLVTDDGSAVVLDQLGDITRIAAVRKDES